MSIANYSEIPRDIARKIAVEHLNFIEDFEAFKEVCAGWRSAVRGVEYRPSLTKTQLPWLLLPDHPNIPYRRLLSLTKGMFRKVDVPLPVLQPLLLQFYRYFSSKGCVICVSSPHRKITVLNPITADVIWPPSVPFHLLDIDWNWGNLFYLYKFVLSKRIYEGDSDNDYALAMVSGMNENNLAFWKPGQDHWTIPAAANFKVTGVSDVCFFRGDLYAIDGIGQVMAFATSDRDRPCSSIVAKLRLRRSLSKGYSFYLAGVDSKLLVVRRQLWLKNIDNKPHYGTTHFQVFELNVDNGKTTRLDNLGNKSIFVGLNSTFSVDSSSDKRSCQPNCIYFTDDFATTVFKMTGVASNPIMDMGIYSMTERKIIKQFCHPSPFSHYSPPTWLEA